MSIKVVKPAIKPRYLEAAIKEDLKMKMVFIGGPRQVGKTTLALGLLTENADEQHPAYLNWDLAESQDKIRKGLFPANEKLIILDELAITTKKSFILPTNMVWLPNEKCLLISAMSDSNEDYAFILDSTATKLVGQFTIDYFLSKILPSKGGSHILYLSHPNNICIWSLKESLEIFRLGKKWENNGVISTTTDAPFISNAVFNGRETLIYSIDSGWATGTIHILDIKNNNKIAQFDSRNGHLEMDVDFQNNRIALRRERTIRSSLFPDSLPCECLCAFLDLNPLYSYRCNRPCACDNHGCASLAFSLGQMFCRIGRILPASFYW